MKMIFPKLLQIANAHRTKPQIVLNVLKVICNLMSCNVPKIKDYVFSYSFLFLTNSLKRSISDVKLSKSKADTIGAKTAAGVEVSSSSSSSDIRNRSLYNANVKSFNVSESCSFFSSRRYCHRYCCEYSQMFCV